MGDAADPSAMAGRILAQWPARNPICTALGDGTAEGALALCRVANVALVRIDHATSWLHTALGCEPLPASDVSRPIVRLEDLSAEDRAEVAARSAEDRVFYDKFAAAFDKGGVTAIGGAKL